MQAITTIGLDIAKSVFQVHGIDTEGKNDATDADCEAVTRPNAVCGDQDARATELLDVASYPSLVRSPADLGDQRRSRSPCRVWNRRAGRP